MNNNLWKMKVMWTEEGALARKISLHPMHSVLLKASGDRNEGQNSKNANLPKCISWLNNIIFKEFIFKKWTLLDIINMSIFAEKELDKLTGCA